MKWLLEFKEGKSSFYSPHSHFSLYINMRICKKAGLRMVAWCTIKFAGQHLLTFWANGSDKDGYVVP